MRYVPTFSTPRSGFRVITASAVPMYRPPSSGQCRGTGNRPRSTSPPSSTFSFTGAPRASTSTGGICRFSLTFTASIRSSTGRPGGSPNVIAARLKLCNWFHSDPNAVPYPRTFWNSTAGLGSSFPSR
jgi:hypothetical protein